MPKLPRSVGRIGEKDDSPPVVGLDSNSSFRPGYNPATGLTDSFLLLLEDGGFLLMEDESFILVY